jgi:hypothetical protein
VAGQDPALHRACRKEHVVIVSMLFNNAVDWSSPCDGTTSAGSER